MSKAFIPLQFELGEAMQVDWGETTVYLDGQKTVINLFCNPAEGHEKGIVEGLLRWARRNILVPVPFASDICELNTLLLERCMKYEAHQIKGKPDKVGVMMDEERSMFHPVPGYRFETAQRANVRVNAFSAARFRMNSYSVPVQYTGRIVGVKGDPEPVALRQLSPDTDIGEILLSLMKTEYEQRQENQNLHRLKRAGFPFTKTLELITL